ncbi:MAG: hypothetical protein J3R72DRAFT_138840, partial [Linnemannia gamsii]
FRFSSPTHKIHASEPLHTHIQHTHVHTHSSTSPFSTSENLSLFDSFSTKPFLLPYIALLTATAMPNHRNQTQQNHHRQWGREHDGALSHIPIVLNHRQNNNNDNNAQRGSNFQNDTIPGGSKYTLVENEYNGYGQALMREMMSEITQLHRTIESLTEERNILSIQTKILKNKLHYFETQRENDKLRWAAERTADKERIQMLFVQKQIRRLDLNKEKGQGQGQQGQQQRQQQRQQRGSH